MLDGRGCSAPYLGRFSPQETAPLPIVEEVGWAPNLVWTNMETRKIHAQILGGNIEPSSPEPVAKLHTPSTALIDLAPFNGNLFQLFYSQHPLPDACLLFSFLFLTQYISSSLFFRIWALHFVHFVPYFLIQFCSFA